MRLGNPRTTVGILLLGVAALLLLVGVGASVSGAPAAAQDATGPAAASADDAGGLSLSAFVRLHVLGMQVERGLDLDPEALRAADLPGLSAERRESVSPDGVPVDADLGVDLRAGSHARRADPAAGEAAVAAQAAAPAPLASELALVAAAAVAGAGLLALAWGNLKGLAQKLLVVPVVALYAKVSRAEVFENEVRERLFEAIRARPGIAATDLARHANVAWGTTIYHLDVLEQTRMVVSVREGRHRRYFLNGAPLEQSRHAIAVLQNGTTATVAERIRAAPGLSQKDLALSTGMSPQALHWHLTRLVGAGLVRKEREGRIVRHFPLAG